MKKTATTRNISDRKPSRPGPSQVESLSPGSGLVGVDCDSDGLGDGEVARTTSERNDTDNLDQPVADWAGTRSPANRSSSYPSSPRTSGTRLRASW